jgi:PPOX class probable F420-dependent enzyme
MSLQVESVIGPMQPKAFTVGESKQELKLQDLDPVYRQLLETGVTAALATINKQGQPQLTPVWVNHDGEYINLNSVRGRLKDRNLRNRPELCLMVMNPKNPYHWMTVWGKVEQIIDEDDAQNGSLATNNIDDLAQLYLGQRPYPFRDPSGSEVRVLYKVRPTRVQTFGQP